MATSLNCLSRMYLPDMALRMWSTPPAAFRGLLDRVCINSP